MNDINDRNYENYVDIGGKPVKRVTSVETPPTDTTKFNASTLISYNANDEAIYIDETFDGVTYRTTFTRSDMVITSTLPISAVTIL